MEFAFGYARVSTKGQDKMGGSLSDQRKAIEAFATSMGYTLVEIFDEVGSGVGDKSFHNRPKLKAALEAAKNHEGFLLVWGWDRLSRHSKFREQVRNVFPRLDRIIDIKEAIRLQDASSAARLAHAESVANKTSKATQSSMAKKAAEGSTFGNPKIRTNVQPLGTEAFSKRRAELDEKIAAVLRTHPDSMSLSRQQVAELLNANGIRTLQGKAWTKSRVTNPLKRVRKRLADEEATRLSPMFGAF